MSEKPRSDEKRSQPPCYKIRLKGHLDSRWADWFEGMTITLEEDGTTLLTGEILDQSALHGLLKRIRDLGIELVSVCPDKTGQEGASAGNTPDQS